MPHFLLQYADDEQASNLEEGMLPRLTALNTWSTETAMFFASHRKLSEYCAAAPSSAASASKAASCSRAHELLHAEP